MGAPPPLESWLADATERAHPKAGVRKLLVRAGGNRIETSDRHRQRHVGIGLSAHRFNLPRIVEIRGAIVGGCARGREKENALCECANALQIILATTHERTPTSSSPARDCVAINRSRWGKSAE